jgi:hypothetical protein
MTSIIIPCGEPESARSQAGQVEAPGTVRPEGRGRKPYSRRAERGSRRVIFGCHPFVSVRGGLREGREHTPLCFDPVQFAPLNFCGALRRWSFPSLVQPAKQSSGGFTVFFRPAPSVRVALHERNQTMDGGELCAEKFRIRSVK